MDCIFSVAHDRWLVIRTKTETSLCPIDNSTVKIRAAGKLYEPDEKYTLGDKNKTLENKNLNVKFMDNDTCHDYFTNNILKKENNKTCNVRFNISCDNENSNFIENIERTDIETIVEMSSESTNSDNEDKIELVLCQTTATTTTTDDDDDDDTDQDSDINDIIPPPSDFATDMIPLRKSKSAPAPFKKNQQGASYKI